MDPILLQSYQIGIGIGILVLSTLILFPGTTGLTTQHSEEQLAEKATNNGNSCDATTESSTVQRSKLNSLVQNDKSTNGNNVLTPHRQLNWFIYISIYITIAFVLYFSYTDEGNPNIPLYRRELQNPFTLLKMTFQAYFPNEASVILPKTKTGNKS